MVETPAQTASERVHGVRIRTLNAVMIVLVAVVTFLFLQTAQRTSLEYDRAAAEDENYIACELAAGNLMNTSTYLTTQARLFAATHNIGYLVNYFDEVDEKRSREHDVDIVEELYPNSAAAKSLDAAYAFSDALESRELYSMKLIVEALDMDVDETIAEELETIPYRRKDAWLSPESKLEKARDLVTNEAYEHEVTTINQHVEECKADLTDQHEQDKAQRTEFIGALYAQQRVLTWALLLVVLATILTVVLTVLQPLNVYIARISADERLPERGAFELRFLSRAYNMIYDNNQHTRKRLIHEAEHDPLTGLYNRGAFDKLLAAECTEPLALLIVDIDYFKQVNDEHGHDCGDRVLKKVARQLEHAFRTTDCPCRLGGDEFAVIMTGLEPDQREVVTRKIGAIKEALAEGDDETPAVTLSVGAAFGDGTQHPDELYKRADEALYRVKDAGRNGLAFYDEAAGL